MALACAVALGAAAYGDLLPLRAGTVRGARHMTAESALAATGLLGTPALRASAAAARDRVRALPAVRDAAVEIALPDRVTVTLAEREAVVRWVAGASEWFVDAEGVLFASADPAAAPALRVVDLRSPARTAGERLDPALVAAALRLAAIAPHELRADSPRPQVRIEPGPSGLVLHSGARWEIRFGTPDRFAEKFALARRFMQSDLNRPLDYVDVRSPERIVFSPNN